jgi:hypothetical protein
MHFRQYLHKNYFILKTNHKPLEWLTILLDAHGRRGRWINMLLLEEKHVFSIALCD